MKKPVFKNKYITGTIIILLILIGGIYYFFVSQNTCSQPVPQSSPQLETTNSDSSDLNVNEPHLPEISTDQQDEIDVSQQEIKVNGYIISVYQKELVNEENNTKIRLLNEDSRKTKQTFDVRCIKSENPISLGDFNFDGYQDFSIFEASYAGANTSSIYFLYNPKTKHFFRSSFEGTSLEFDTIKKRVYEFNQSVGGNNLEESEYKVVNNKMVLIKRVCKVFDIESDTHITVPCE